MLEEVLKELDKNCTNSSTIGFRLSSTLKKDFEKFCKENNVSVTTMLNAMVKVVLFENNKIFKG